MAAGSWTLFQRGKWYLGAGAIDLSADTFKLTLHATAASANIVTGNVTTFGSIGNVSSGGGVATGTGIALGALVWTGVASANDQTFKWDASDVTFSPVTSNLSAVRYAVIRRSNGAVTSGYPLCYCALSTAQFNIDGGNTLTIQMNASGIFTLE